MPRGPDWREPMARPKKGGLGKGLEALFADNTTADVAVTALKIRN